MYLYGKPVAEKIKERILEETKLLKLTNQHPTLAIVELCNDDSLLVYLKTRTKIAEELGINIKVFKQEITSFNDLKELIEKLNNDDSIWGIMIDEPIPHFLDKTQVFQLIDPFKDVEGLNWSEQMKEEFSLFVPPAAAVFEIIKYYDIIINAKNVCMIGYSENVGKPIGTMFSKLGGKLSVCDKNTSNIESISKNSDIICVAIGNREFIKSNFVSNFSIVFDIGVHYDEDGKLCGDVDRKVYDLVKDICPSPKGIGPVTNVILFDNLLKLRRLKYGKL